MIFNWLDMRQIACDMLGASYVPPPYIVSYNRIGTVMRFQWYIDVGVSYPSIIVRLGSLDTLRCVEFMFGGVEVGQRHFRKSLMKAYREKRLARVKRVNRYVNEADWQYFIEWWHHEGRKKFEATHDC